MSIADKALWVIERNSGRDLTLPAIAAACGVSRAHLASAFGSATGWPVMKYLRARRLSEAASALAAGAPDILDLALDSGYGSHEAFTRAFREQFGVTPEQVRERASTDGLPLMLPMALRPQPAPALAPPALQEAAVIRAVGLARRHPLGSGIGIPAQWQEFMARWGEIAHPSADIPIGLMQQSGEDDGFLYTCAAEVGRLGPVPRAMVAIEWPARRYAVFEHTRHVSTLFDSYAEIWNAALPALGWAVADDAPVIERHHESFDPGSGEGGLSLWIPLAAAGAAEVTVAR